MLFAFFPYYYSTSSSRLLRISFFFLFSVPCNIFGVDYKWTVHSLFFFSIFFAPFFCFSFLSFSLSISGSPLDLFSSHSLSSDGLFISFFIIMFLLYQTNTVGFVTHSPNVDTVISHKFVITAITKANCPNGEWSLTFCSLPEWTEVVSTLVEGPSILILPQIKIPEYELWFELCVVLKTKLSIVYCVCVQVFCLHFVR